MHAPTVVTFEMTALPMPTKIWFRDYSGRGTIPGVLDGPVHDPSLPEQCRGVPLLKVHPRGPHSPARELVTDHDCSEPLICEQGLVSRLLCESITFLKRLDPLVRALQLKSLLRSSEFSRIRSLSVSLCEPQ
jgi:hypothetical protein